MKNTLSLILSATVLFFFMACTEDSTQQESELADTLVSISEKAADGDTEKDSLDSADKNGTNEKSAETVEASKYICPNSCPEGHADESGNCSVCGMELVENPDYSEASN